MGTGVEVFVGTSKVGVESVVVVVVFVVFVVGVGVVDVVDEVGVVEVFMMIGYNYRG